MATFPTPNNNQIPAQTAVTSGKGLASNQWFHWWKKDHDNLNALIAGGPYVTAGGGGGTPVNILQGTLAERPAGVNGDIYFTTDTGAIYVNVAGTWRLEIPAFNGDATSPIGVPTLTLATVNPVTHGSFTNISAMTVNEKGLVTFVASGPSTGTSAGIPGSVQLAGEFGTFEADASNFFYDTSTGSPIVQVGLADNGQISIGHGGSYLLGDTDGNLLLNAPLSITLETTAGTGLIVNPSGAIGIGTTSPNYGAPGQVLTSEGPSSPPQWVDNPPTTLTIAFSYGDVSPELIGIVPANKLIYSVELIIDTAFNGVGAALSVGDSSNASSMMPTNLNDPTTAGTYSSTPSFLYTSATNVYITIASGSGGTAGNGYVSIRLQDR